jgi:myosin heavy subunit
VLGRIVATAVVGAGSSHIVSVGLGVALRNPIVTEQAARIEELSQALHNAKETLRTETALHTQQHQREQQQIRAAQEQVSQQMAESQRLQVRVTELEAQCRTANEALEQTKRKLADATQRMEEQEAGMLLLWPQLHAHMQAADSATQTADSLQRKVQQLEADLERERSRNRNRFTSSSGVISDEVLMLREALAQRELSMGQHRTEQSALRNQVEQLRAKQTQTESELMQAKARHDAVVLDRNLLKHSVMGLRSQVDAMTATIKTYEQRDLVTTVVGGVGALSSVLSAVAAANGQKITPLNVGDILKSLQEPNPSKAPPSAQTTEPKDEWRRMVGEQLLLGWRPENDDLMSIIRAVMTAEAELEQVKAGKSPLLAKSRPSIEQDHLAMERTLRARHDCAKRSGKDAAYAWSRQQYLLSAWLELSLRRECESQLDQLKEETARLFRRPRGGR